jgi:RNA polymerase sigma-70 factor (ECF subfamily)
MENCWELQGNQLQIILQNIAGGDQLAFRQVYHCFHKRLLHFAFALVKTREAAEEIVEDVFIRLWNNRASITSINNLKIYVYSA